jgi:hypothetical protein
MAAVALVVSFLALAVAGWSAWTAHRALAIERDRRHGELIPNIRVEEATFEDQQEGLWFTNDGPLDYTSVRVRVETPGNVSPVGALQIGEGWSTEGDLGPMELGERRLIPIRRNKPMPGTTLRLRLTCQNNQGTWPIYREVEFTPPPMAMWGR